AAAPGLRAAPLRVRRITIEGGPSPTSGARKGGVAPVCQQKIDVVWLGVESTALAPPRVLESQEFSEERPVTHGRDLVSGDGYRRSARTVVFSGGREKRGRGWGGWGRDLGVLLVPPPTRASDPATDPAPTPKP